MDSVLQTQLRQHGPYAKYPRAAVRVCSCVVDCCALSACRTLGCQVSWVKDDQRRGRDSRPVHSAKMVLALHQCMLLIYTKCLNLTCEMVASCLDGLASP